jgi:hypothetical protein
MDTFLGATAPFGSMMPTFAVILTNKILFHAQSDTKNINSKKDKLRRKRKTPQNMIIWLSDALCLSNSSRFFVLEK